jgi:hypothetical protein
MTRNPYKESGAKSSMSQRGRKGQVALFIIIALVIVGVLLLIFLYPRSSLQTQIDENPAGYLRTCIQPGIQPELNRIAAQGGERNPEGFILYNGTKVKYLCYTSEYYQTCVNQAPLLVEQVEREISSIVDQNTKTCLEQMKADYDRRGISVSSGNVKTNTTITTKGISILVDTPLTVTRESSQTYKEFTVTVPSNLYELLITAENIVEFEAVYGDAETTLYAQYYPNLKIRKNLLSDGTTIYSIEDITTHEIFTFASRSLAWPAGYGVE